MERLSDQAVPAYSLPILWNHTLADVHNERRMDRSPANQSSRISCSGTITNNTRLDLYRSGTTHRLSFESIQHDRLRSATSGGIYSAGFIAVAQLDMEYNEIYLTDREKASNAYIMSLIAVVMGLPMPIINLIATGIFYLMSRKGSEYVRWHATQAFISQIPLFVLNNILFWWTINILLFAHPLSGLYIAYFILVNIYNIADFYATAVSAVRSRKGVTYRWFLYGVLTDMVIGYGKKETPQQNSLLRKAGIQSAASILIFASSLTLMNITDWMKVCGLKPNSVQEWTGEAIWRLTSMQLHEITGPDIALPVDSIVGRLCTVNGIDTSSVSIHVCRTNEINAYSMPGRRILVNTGLILECRNEQELAGVMAHELAHIQEQHIRYNMQLQLVAIVAGRLLGGSDIGATSNITNLMQTLTQNHFARDMESEADTTAVRYLIKAGVDPEGLSEFMDRVDSYGYMEFLSDHPDSKKRAGLIRKYTKEHKSNAKYTEILAPDTWKRLQNSIKAMHTNHKQSF